MIDPTKWHPMMVLRFYAGPKEHQYEVKSDEFDTLEAAQRFYAQFNCTGESPHLHYKAIVKTQECSFWSGLLDQSAIPERLRPVVEAGSTPIPTFIPPTPTTPPGSNNASEGPFLLWEGEIRNPLAPTIMRNHRWRVVLENCITGKLTVEWCEGQDAMGAPHWTPSVSGENNQWVLRTALHHRYLDQRSAEWRPLKAPQVEVQRQ